jgi:uncharacterized protein
VRRYRVTAAEALIALSTWASTGIEQRPFRGQCSDDPGVILPSGHVNLSKIERIHALIAHPTMNELPTTEPGRADPDSGIDSSILCSRCEAVCCRLTVYVMADDPTPEYLIDQDEHGMDVMRRLDDGWCTALDRDTMRCSIYALRPQVCRDFDMGGGDCRKVRRNDRQLGIAVIEETD